MTTEVAKSSSNGAQSSDAVSPYGSWRDVLRYDPFSRFFSNVDPEIDVLRTDRGFDVEIPVAGYKPEHVDITVKEDVLTVSAQSERRSFTRSLRLPEDIDADKIQAHVQDGMLSLKLERRPEAQPRRIKVTS